MQRIIVFATVTLLAFCFLAVQAIPIQRNTLEKRQAYSPDPFDKIPDAGVDGVDRLGVDNVDNQDVDGMDRNLHRITVIEESNNHRGVFHGVIGSVGGLLNSIFGSGGGILNNIGA